MASAFRPFAAVSFASALALLFVPACAQQGEGERCEMDSDCDSGLSCVSSSELLVQGTDRCCPEAGTEDDERCTRETPSGSSGTSGSGGTSNGGSSSGMPSSGGTEAGESSGGNPAGGGTGGAGGEPTFAGGTGGAGAAPTEGGSSGAAGAPSAAGMPANVGGGSE